jgi:hypothetical protein
MTDLTNALIKTLESKWDYSFRLPTLQYPDPAAEIILRIDKPWLVSIYEPQSHTRMLPFFICCVATSVHDLQVYQFERMKGEPIQFPHTSIRRFTFANDPERGEFRLGYFDGAHMPNPLVNSKQLIELIEKEFEAY